MIHLYHKNKKKLIVISIFSTLLLLEGCDKADDSEEHLQKGVEYINKGE